MSRVPQKFPSLENLPRRTVLTGAVAIPLALAATGQVSARSAEDPRLAEIDAMIVEIDDALDAFLKRASQEGEIDADGSDVYELAETNWYAAREVLKNYAEALNAKPCHSPADAIALAKIANYWCVADEDLLTDVKEYTCVRSAIAAVLSSVDVALYQEPAVRQQERLEREERWRAYQAAPRRPRDPSSVNSVNAGEAIIRIRRIGDAVRAALTRECRIPDGTLKSHKAIAVTNRRYAELDALSVELRAGKPIDMDINEWLETPYIWDQREDFVIWGELILAYRDDWRTHPTDEPGYLLLQKMLSCAREIGDELVVKAQGCRSTGRRNV